MFAPERSYANSPWGDLEVGQRVVNNIFAKLRLTAKQFAQTLDESETRCIHMKGDSNIFSYYSIKDFVRLAPSHPYHTTYKREISIFSKSRQIF